MTSNAINFLRFRWVVAFALTLLAYFPATFAQAFTQTITSPKSGEVVGNTLTIAVAVTGFNITGVVAKVDDRQTPLTLNSSKNLWEGALSLEGLIAGNYLLTATAITDQRETATDTVAFIKDAPPVLTVSEPSNWAVAAPTLHVNATCQDDNTEGCGSLTVSRNGVVLAQGKDSLDATINVWFDSYNSKQALGELIISGKGSGGATYVRRSYVALPSIDPLKVETVMPGRILDANDEQIVYIQPSTAEYRHSVEDTLNKRQYLLKSLNRATGQESLLQTITLPDPLLGAFHNPINSDEYVLHDVLNIKPATGALVYPRNFDYTTSTFALASNDRFNLLPTFDNRFQELYLREIKTGAITPVSPEPVFTLAAALSSAGEVVYITRDITTNIDTLQAWHAGTTTTISAQPSDGFTIWGTYLGIYGDTVVYNSKSPAGLFVASLAHPDRSMRLSSSQPFGFNEGWLAYEDRDISGYREHIRSPEGEVWIVPESLYGGVLAVSPTGEVVYVRYLSESSSIRGEGQTILQVYSFDGKRNVTLPTFPGINDFNLSGPFAAFDFVPHWYNGDWHFSSGNTLFSLNGTTTPPPPACPELGKGDVNADGKVSIGDVVLSLRMAVHLDPIHSICAKNAADANCDGLLNTADSILILRHFLFGDPFPACSN